jgi:hypothetical protein
LAGHNTSSAKMPDNKHKSVTILQPTIALSKGEDKQEKIKSKFVNDTNAFSKKLKDNIRASKLI